MSDPERLLHGSAGALSARLVRAGHDEGPSRRSLERTLAAVGVATTTLGAAGTAGALGSTAGAGTAGAVGAAAGAGTVGTVGALGGAGKVTTTLTLLGLAKWAGLGAAGGVVVSLAAHGLEMRAAETRVETNVVATAGITPSIAPSANVPVPRGASAPDPAQDSNAPLLDPPASPADSTASRRSLTAGPLGAPPPEVNDTANAPLAAEVSFVDRGRALFRRGDARGTLGALDGYEREFPERRLLPEVLLLRMEASSIAGDTARARQFARTIVRDYGRSPHAARARAVLGESPAGQR